MPSKKKKYNARFPAGRIKKIMQTDEEVGKVAQAVPVIISRTLELFVESLLTKSMQITLSRNAKTLTPSHMKQCILSESRFDFLKDLVKNIPDASVQEDNENNAIFEATTNKTDDPEPAPPTNSNHKAASRAADKAPKQLEMAANFYTEQSTSRTPVIQYGPKVTKTATKKLSFSVNSLIEPQSKNEQKISVTVDAESVPVGSLSVPSIAPAKSGDNHVHPIISDNIPPLIPISHNFYSQSEDSLCIDEDYDN